MSDNNLSDLVKFLDTSIDIGSHEDDTEATVSDSGESRNLKSTKVDFQKPNLENEDQKDFENGKPPQSDRYRQATNMSYEEELDSKLEAHKEASLQDIFQELKESEIQYINDLKRLVTLYIPLIQINTTNDKVLKFADLFNSLSEIYETAQKFLEYIRNCDEENVNTEIITNIFVCNKNVFDRYPTYLYTKQKVYRELKEVYPPIINDLQEALKDPKDFPDYLQMPNKRLSHYILLLEQIKKHLIKNNESIKDANEALEIVEDKLTTANSAITIDLISKCPIFLPDYAPYVKREKFKCLKPKKYDCILFLFQKILVFTSSKPKKPDKFVYVESHLLNEVVVDDIEDKPLQLKFISFSKDKKHGNGEFILLEAENEKIKQMWKNMIEAKQWNEIKKEREKTLEAHGFPTYIKILRK